MANGLVYIGTVVELSTIPNADRIVLAKVDCLTGGQWLGVVGKDSLAVGSTAEVYLQDSILPSTDTRFDFMASRHYRVRMARFKGVPSECLVFPQSVAGNPGDDVTEAAGVVKYEKAIPANMRGMVAGDFPSFIPKTDEPNWQKSPALVNALVGKQYYVSLKADGTSCTVANYQGHLYVCSRNLELKDTAENVYWQVVHKYEVDTKLPDGMAIQFEVVGPGINKNTMGLASHEMRLFNVYNITERRYLDFAEALHFSELNGFRFVDLLEFPKEPFSLDVDLRKLAEQKYANGAIAEGVVIRPLVEETVKIENKNDVGDVLSTEYMRLSMKSLNLLYKE